MAVTIRLRLVLVGIVGLVAFAGLLVWSLDRTPFGLLPPIVEAIVVAPVILSILSLNIALQSNFDHEAYVHEMGALGIGVEYVRIGASAAFIGIAVGILIGFTGLATPWRVLIIGIVEYLVTTFVFAVANKRHYDDSQFRDALDM